MKKSVKGFTLVLLTALLLALLPVSVFARLDPVSISSTSSVTLDPKDKYTVSYTISPSGGAYGQIDVSSSNTSVAWAGYVNNQIEIQAYEPGSCTITLSVPGTDARTTISVSVTGTPSSSSSESSSVDYEAVYTYRSERESASVVSGSRSSTSAASSKAGNVSTKTGTVKLTEKAPREEVINAARAGTPLNNYASVSSESLKSASGAVSFDTKSGNAVVGRLTINPANAKNLSGDILTGVYAGTGNTKKVQSMFNKLSGNCVVVLCDQKSFNMNVGIAVRIGGMSADNLSFYSYDADANSYSKLTVSNVSKDSNNFLHFTTKTGGYIVVSDGAL